ncbi:MAG: redox-regulated ATPase YchF [Melioribacteraceae bacterium]|nr:redox-regulated ATPase YchF [Melioribacteraceae bacterium]
MQIGLVGLQYSGKTTLFNTVAKIEADSVQAVKEEATIEVVKVPDERLDDLSKLFNPKKKINATIEVFDIPGLRMSDDGKVKITTAFLNNVKNNDALFYVIRAFENDAVMHPMESIDPVRDVQFLETEFLLSDLAFLENRIGKLEKEIIKSKDEKFKKELVLIKKCLEHAEKELPLRTLELDVNEVKALSGYQLLSLKPVAIAVNLDENGIETVDEIIDSIKTELNMDDAEIIPFFAKIENELALMDEEDQTAFMEDYGIKESALSKILGRSYNLLGLQSFLTVGEDECRAWTIRKGYTAQEAAGVIHTDFYNRFIRAEVIFYKDLLEHKSIAKCKEAGVWHLEGKDYVVQDGDILDIRHN